MFPIEPQQRKESRHDVRGVLLCPSRPYDEGGVLGMVKDESDKFQRMGTHVNVIPFRLAPGDLEAYVPRHLLGASVDERLIQVQQ
mgnify:CR=1 FL=1